MKNLYEAARAAEVKTRLSQLQAESPPLWGKMNAPQAVAHCSVAMGWALGDNHPPRLFMGRILGQFIKPFVFRDDEPMRRNSPTSPDLVVEGPCDLLQQRQRLYGQIDRFVAGGPAACTTSPHPFFGRLTPEEWAILMYKHLDHHLRQFGA
ncbi:MAG: DUF1569 domain-containing protein [Terracidiphilus sp.]